MAARKKAAEKPPEEPKRDFWIEHLTWQGIKIEAKYEEDWLGCNAKHGHNNAHLEVRSLDPEKAPLPITETGYKSHFIQPGLVEEFGGPAGYVQAWLELEAQTPAWRTMQAPKQLDLFG